MTMLDLVLSLALLGAAEDAAPMPAEAIESVVAASPEAQGYEDWWLALLMGKDKRHRHYPSSDTKENPPVGIPPGNTPAPGPLPLVLLGMGVLGVGGAARSRRRKRKAATPARAGT